MNILVINGSPEGDNSNTIKLTNAFLDGINSVNIDISIKIEKLNISQMNINFCNGCFSCWKITPGECCISDDMKIIIEKLLWANITIWSFPLYYFSLPGKLKALIDRQLPLTLPFMLSNVEGGGHPSRYDMSRKKTILISTCGFYTAESNYGSVIAQFDKILGKGKYTTLFCGQGELFRVQELSNKTEEYLKIVRQAGKEYILGDITNEIKLKLKESIFERKIFERLADASWGISKTGDREDSYLVFTKQMAALYNPKSYKGKDIILDMNYTDIGKRYRIILGKTESNVIEQFSEEATTIINTPFSVWQDIAAGELDGVDALMKKLYSVEGDFDLMLKWDEYFGQNQYINNNISSQSKTNMNYILIPWIIFWITSNLNIYFGSIFSIFICSILPLLFYKNKKTIYDIISSVLVSIFSLLLLINLPITIIVPLSYFSFGIMWSISYFFKIPLTAHYSMNDYGGESILSNSIFIKTNRILTIIWGILYLITPIWTYFIMYTSLKEY